MAAPSGIPDYLFDTMTTTIYIYFTQGSHFSGDTKFHAFSRLFTGKTLKSRVNLALNHCLCLSTQMTKTFFCKWHFEKWILKPQIYKFQVLSMFWVKIPGFSHFLSKFQAFSRPGKVNDKILGVYSFPGGNPVMLQL